MSTTFNGSTPSSNGADPSLKMNTTPSDTDGIVFFDATLARKNKMKQIAAAEIAKNQPGNNGTATNGVAAPAPVAQTPVAPAPVAVAPAPVVPAPVAQVPVAPVAPAAISNGQPVAPQPVQAAPVQAAPAAPTNSGVTSASGEQLSRSDLQTFLVNFVVEQTGYPEEMVELDADLEADLGIDSIKKAQMFGELAEHLKVEIEINEDMSLDDYPTLNHIVDFLLNPPAPSSSPAAPVAQAPAPIAPTPVAPTPVAQVPVAPVAPTAISNGQPAAPQPVVPQPVQAAPAAHANSGVTSASGEQLSRSDLQTFLVNFVVEQTGYPEEMVELDADLEADLGIDSIKKAQMFGELAEHLKVEIEINEDMSLDDYPSLNHIVDFLMKS